VSWPRTGQVIVDGGAMLREVKEKEEEEEVEEVEEAATSAA